MSLGSQDIEEARQRRLERECVMCLNPLGPDEPGPLHEVCTLTEAEVHEGELLDCGCPVQYVDDENHHQEGCQWGTGPVREDEQREAYERDEDEYDELAANYLPDDEPPF
jgi:hypothetical protein